MELVWKKRSLRLSVAEHNGRTFRIEKNAIANSTAGFVVKEMNSLHQPVRLEQVRGMHQAKRIAEDWLSLPPAIEPVRMGGTGTTDLTLGLGSRR